MAKKKAAEDIEKYRRPAQQVAALSEVGYGGPNQFGGTINEEFHPNLKGTQAIKTYKEMWLNDDILGAVMLAITMLIRQAKWYALPWMDPNATETPTQKPKTQAEAKKMMKAAAEGDKGKAEFLQSCMDDMSHTWEDMVCEILTMLPFGWAWLETVYKKRDGIDPDTGSPSRFTDGKFGWRKHALRSQDTLSKWVFDDKGGVQGMVQRLNSGIQVTIPINKSLLFRTMTYKGNPEGRSVFRNAYRSWYFKKRIQEIEAIGIERDLTGMPTMTAAEGVDLWNPNDAQAVIMRQEAEKIVRNVRRDEQEGLLMPFGWVFELASAQGGKRIDTNQVISRYDTRLAMTVLADFIMLGTTGGGSMALGELKEHSFDVAVDGWLKMIQSVLNRYAVPRLFMVNGETNLTQLPTVEYEDIEVPDLDALGNYIGRLALAGWKPFPNPVLERFLLRTGSMPVEGVEVGRDKAEEEAARAMEQAKLTAELRPQPQAGFPAAGQQRNTPARANRPANRTGDPYRNRGTQTKESNSELRKGIQALLNEMKDDDDAAEE